MTYNGWYAIKPTITNITKEIKIALSYLPTPPVVVVCPTIYP